MKKKHTSLSFQILALCLGPVLNSDIQHALDPFLDMTRNGAAILSTLPSMEMQLAVMERMLATIMVAVTDPYVDSLTGRLCVTMSHTVRAAGGNILGVVAVDMFVDSLNDMVSQKKITEDGSTVLTDATGLYIVHPNPEYIMKTNIFDDPKNLNRSLNRREILSDQITVSFNGDSYVCSSPVSGTDWILISEGSLYTL
jgi:hypothetical protein